MDSGRSRTWLNLMIVVILPVCFIGIGCRARCPQTGVYRAASQALASHLAERDATAPRDILAPTKGEVCLREATAAIIHAPQTAAEVLGLLERQPPAYVLAGDDVTWQAVRAQPWFLERYRQVGQWRDVYPEPTALTLFAYTPSPFDLGETIEAPGAFQTEDVVLRGYHLSSSHWEPPVPLHLSLFWDDYPGGDYRGMRVTLRVVAPDTDQVWFTLRDTLKPTGLAWRPDARLAQRFVIVPPEELPQGAYEIRVALEARNGRPILAADGNAMESEELCLAEIQHPPDASRDPIAVDTETDYRFGDAEGTIVLAGYDLLPWAKAGEDMRLALFWAANADVVEDYHVFTHLLSSQGELVTQSDGVPVYGFYPTSGWSAGDHLRDLRVLALPDALPTGVYTVAVGLYKPDSGVRAPVFDPAGEALPMDRVVLGQLTVYSDPQ